MSSEVEICNLALSHLGDSATVASIEPPEGSAQAEHCARWYPIARDSLLEMHDWRFARRRAALAEVINPTNQWSYAYARPSDCLKMLAILHTDAPDDYSQAFALAAASNIQQDSQQGIYTPQRFDEESDDSGNQIILTNQDLATARYTRFVTDTAKFSPLFRDALAAYLASYLAGPVLKGTAGSAASVEWMKIAMGKLAYAKLSDGAQQRQDTAHNVPWMAGR